MKPRISVLVSVAAAIAIVACEGYRPPPHAVIEGLESGVLSDPRAPIVVDFGMAVDPSTLDVKVALYQTDVEGNLYDEDDDPDTQLAVIAARAEPIDGDTRVRITPDSAFPVGPKLVLVVEAGLASRDGTVARKRQELPFSFTVKCAAGRPTALASGVYFVLLDVEKPLGTQIQLYGAIDVDAASGALIGQFTNADRNPDGSRCPSGCPSTDVCRTLPATECVAPSTRAGSVDEWPDFVPNATPPTGFSFLVRGCAVDDDHGASGVVTAPATMIVESPPVTIDGLTMTAEFAPGAQGVVRATGSLVADMVRLGTSPLGPGKGTMIAVRIPDAAAPPGVPQPPAVTTSADGGPDASH